jgi:hypothetical protein
MQIIDKSGTHQEAWCGSRNCFRELPLIFFAYVGFDAVLLKPGESINLKSVPFCLYHY